jgi:dihydroorotase-like cyclic amidohydrolase
MQLDLVALLGSAGMAVDASTGSARLSRGGLPAIEEFRLKVVRTALAMVAVSVGLLLTPPAVAQEFDLVLRGGRVLDPESGLDAVRDVGIRGGVIRAVSESPLTGTANVDARALVVSPGFIDLHQHAQQPDDFRLKAQDGVTTVCELEVGTADVDAWYAAREGRTPINFAVSVGHIPCRMRVMGDRPEFLPGAKSGAATRTADATQLAEVGRLIENGLERGAVAVGFGLQYTPAATEREMLAVFQVAAKFNASCHLHMRAKGDLGPQNVFSSVLEIIAAAAVTGAPAHICHVQSTAARFTPAVLQVIADAHARGAKLSVECYPYTAGMTDIKSAIFDPGWRERGAVDFNDLQWPATGERLTEESFARYRQTGGLVIIHANPEEIIRAAVAHPLTMIASDGLRGHPRHAGTSARILGRYVREMKAITLMQAVAKLSLQPARRLEERVPAMKNKGRVRVGADADLVVFNADTVIDRATYTQPDLSSAGIPHVLVAGEFVVRDGVFQTNAKAGRAVRAPLGAAP